MLGRLPCLAGRLHGAIRSKALRTDHVFRKVAHSIGIDSRNGITSPAEILRHFVIRIDSNEMYRTQWHVSVTKLALHLR